MNHIWELDRLAVCIQAHTSNLANSFFLPPGSAVVELIQRFWTWMALDKSFKDQTDTLADIHHFAWRALHVNQTVYLNPRDLMRCGAPCPGKVLHVRDRLSPFALWCYAFMYATCIQCMCSCISSLSYSALSCTSLESIVPCWIF
jgi:hypothetical protein